MSFAQKRKTIDRTSQTTEKKKSTNTTTSSTSSISTGKSSNTKKQVQKSYFKISPQTVSFGSDGGTRTFEVSSSQSWSISVNTASWGHLTRNGNTLSLTVDPNNGTSSRTDYFNISSGSKILRVDISQSKATSFSVSSQNLSFSSSGGSQTLTITSSGTWNIGTSTYDWGHLTKSGNQLIVSIDPNNSTSSRTDYFTIKSGDSEKRINITQAGTSTTLSVSSEELSFNSTGGTQTIVVSANGTWNIGTNIASWGHLTKDGNLLRVTIDKNNNTSSRTDWFTVKCGNIEKRVNISQSGQTQNTPSAQVESIKIDHNQYLDDGKGMIIHVKFDVQHMKGKQGRVVAYFYDDNNNALKDLNRTQYGTTGTVSYVATGKNFTPSYDNSEYSDFKLSIPYSELHQSGTSTRTIKFKICIWDQSVTPNVEFYSGTTYTSFSFTPGVESILTVDGSTTDKTKHFSETGGRETYYVKTSANSYETWGVPTWCSIENKTSSSFTLVCSRNTTSNPRNDYMKVKAAGKEIRIDISQDACSGPTAKVNRLWVDHNVFNGMVKGMKIHIDLDVNGMKGRTVKYCVFFYKEDNRTKLVNIYGNQVSASSTGTSSYDNCNWSDWWIFVPYTNIFSAANSNGRFSLDVEIQDINGKLLTRHENYQFYQN